jgi:hypothetical protein
MVVCPMSMIIGLSCSTTGFVHTSTSPGTLSVTVGNDMFRLAYFSPSSVKTVTSGGQCSSGGITSVTQEHVLTGVSSTESADCRLTYTFVRSIFPAPRAIFSVALFHRRTFELVSIFTCDVTCCLEGMFQTRLCTMFWSYTAVWDFF